MPPRPRVNYKDGKKDTKKQRSKEKITPNAKGNEASEETEQLELPGARSATKQGYLLF
jgi:hypothetical protein